MRPRLLTTVLSCLLAGGLAGCNRAPETPPPAPAAKPRRHG